MTKRNISNLKFSLTRALLPVPGAYHPISPHRFNPRKMWLNKSRKLSNLKIYMSPLVLSKARELFGRNIFCKKVSLKLLLRLSTNFQGPTFFQKSIRKNLTSILTEKVNSISLP